jgi:hypothetical protein
MPRYRLIGRRAALVGAMVVLRRAVSVTGLSRGGSLKRLECYRLTVDRLTV